ncbi:MAG: virulence-associated protein E [Eubacterium sp.]|nr:virulence-associated protein E [Eubacterium sp.]
MRGGENLNEELQIQLEYTKNGTIKQSISNCVAILENDPFLAGAIRFNELTERIDIVRNPGWNRFGTTLTDTDMSYIMMYLDDAYGLTSEKRIRNAVTIAANNNKYHPVRDCLNTLVWDGHPRIRYALHHFLGADTSDLTYESLKLFMLGAICRVFDPGCKFDIMLCLVGDQGAGKSTFFRFLALKDEWFSDDIRRLDDDNIYRKLQGHWIIEMSEMLATANAKSFEEIKSFISRQKEVYKIPYETHPADRHRQCVFGGTTNKKYFLPADRSGSRRFLPVEGNASEAETHILADETASRAYIRQMWAEAMELYRNGNYSLSFSPEMAEHMKNYQASFVPEDSDKDAILGFLEECSYDFVCSKLLYYEALQHTERDTPARWDLNAINEILRLYAKDWKEGPTHRFSVYGTQRSWIRKAPKDEFVDLSDLDESLLPFR